MVVECHSFLKNYTIQDAIWARIRSTVKYGDKMSFCFQGDISLKLQCCLEDFLQHMTV